MDHERRISRLQDRVDVLEERVRMLEEALFEGVSIPGAWCLTASQERIFGCLVKREIATKEAIMAALYTDFGREVTGPKTIDVFICKIRKKVRPFGVEIRNVRGRGFSLVNREQFGAGAA